MDRAILATHFSQSQVPAICFDAELHVILLVQQLDNTAGRRELKIAISSLSFDR